MKKAFSNIFTLAKVYRNDDVGATRGTVFQEIFKEGAGLKTKQPRFR